MKFKNMKKCRFLKILQKVKCQKISNGQLISRDNKVYSLEKKQFNH